MADSRIQSQTSSESQLYDIGTDSSWYSCAQLAVTVCDHLEAALRADTPYPCLAPGQVDSAGMLISSGSSQSSAESGDSIAHLPPEIIRDQSQIPDARAHVYGVGVLLYHGLCGRLPFTTADKVELTRQINHDLPQPPRQLAHRIPQELEDICLQALSKAPVDRQESPRVVADQLRKAMGRC